MSNEIIVNFGKYKDKPLSVLLEDKGYCQYLMEKNFLQNAKNDTTKKIAIAIHEKYMALRDVPSKPRAVEEPKVRSNDEEIANQLIIRLTQFREEHPGAFGLVLDWFHKQK